MEAIVKKYIKTHELITAGDRVLVGVSGGADSLALLYFLKENFHQCRIGAAHLNHGLRAEAMDDEAFVRDFCEREGIPFYTRTVDVAALAKTKKIPLEEAGREARYAFFKQTAVSEGYHTLALGHHQDDQAETILMRLIRGTGVAGARGILPVSVQRGMRLIRPFLCVTKQQILDYCEEHGLDYCTDMTNFEDDVTRNKIRLTIMPELRAINPEVTAHLAAFGAIAADYEAFLTERTESFMAEQATLTESGEAVSTAHLLKENKTLMESVLRAMIRHVKGNLKEISYQHVQAICEKLMEPDTSWTLSLPGGVTAKRRYDVFSVEKEERKERQIGCYPLKENAEIYLAREHLCVTTAVEQNFSLKNAKELKNHSEKFFDYGKIKGKLYLRKREPGDFFYPVGVTGRKKIKDYLIDKKIPLEKRDGILLLAAGHQILWIYGYAIDRTCRPDEKTKKALRVSCQVIPEL